MTLSRLTLSMTPAITHPDMKSLLRDRGLTQAQVARRMGISPALLSRLFSGEREWSMLTLRAFAQATRIPMKDITGGNGAR